MKTKIISILLLGAALFFLTNCEEKSNPGYPFNQDEVNVLNSCLDLSVETTQELTEQLLEYDSIITVLKDSIKILNQELEDSRY